MPKQTTRPVEYGDLLSSIEEDSVYVSFCLGDSTYIGGTIHPAEIDPNDAIVQVTFPSGVMWVALDHVRSVKIGGRRA